MTCERFWYSLCGDAIRAVQILVRRRYLDELLRRGRWGVVGVGSGCMFKVMYISMDLFRVADRVEA